MRRRPGRKRARKGRSTGRARAGRVVCGGRRNGRVCRGVVGRSAGSVRERLQGPVEGRPGPYALGRQALPCRRPTLSTGVGGRETNRAANSPSVAASRTPAAAAPTAPRGAGSVVIRRAGRLRMTVRTCRASCPYCTPGIQREWLPQESGFGAGMTCWRRLRDRHEAGVCDRPHQVLLTEFHQAGELDWSRTVIDSSHRHARRGGPRPDRARSTGADRARQTT